MSSMAGLRRAHVHGRLADLADALRERDHARHVVVVREVRRLADGLPDDGGALEDRRPGGEAERGQQHRGRGDCTGGVRRRHHQATAGDGLALERPRDVAFGGELGNGLLAGLRQGPGILSLGHRGAVCRRATPPRSGAAPPSLGGLMVRSRTAGDRRRPGVPYGVGARGVTLGVRLRAQRDHVGQLGHRVEVAERGEPLEAERVEPIPGQQREVRIVGPDDAPGRVVLQVALADRLDEQRVALAAAGDGLAVRLRLRRRPRSRCWPAGRPRRAVPPRAGARRLS